MKEKLIDSHEVSYNNGYILYSLVNKGNEYIIEQCIVIHKLRLIYSRRYTNYIRAKNKFKKLINYQLID